jgi:hypothetical protein
VPEGHQQRQYGKGDRRQEFLPGGGSGQGSAARLRWEGRDATQMDNTREFGRPRPPRALGAHLAHDRVNRAWLGDERDDTHHRPAPGANEGIDLINAA